MEDSEIIGLFMERSETAIIELTEKYGRMCMRIAMNILQNEEDAEECVNDSYLGIWNAIPPNTPSPLAAYLCRVVRNRAVSKLDERRRTGVGDAYTMCIDELEEVIESPGAADDMLDEKTLSGYINEFLKSLDQEDRMIFVGRFWFVDSYETIAKNTGLKEGTVRTRLSRMKDRLKKYLKERGINV